MARLLTACWLLLACIVGVVWAADGLVPVPPLQARVTDLTGTLSGEQRARLEASLERYERTKGSQIAVLMLPSTQPEAIEQFGIRVAEAWKLGRKGIDDGVIVIVAKADRRMRIEVGYGLEGVIPDAVAKRIVSEQMAPRFQAGDFADGLIAAVDALTRVAAGAGLPAPAAPGRAGAVSGLGGEGMLLVAFIVAALLGRLLRFLFGDLLGSSATAAGTGVAGWLLTGSPLVAGLATLGGFVVALFGLSIALNVLTSGRGGGFGGGRGGGFSGGGGGFGGGGASGRW